MVDEPSGELADDDLACGGEPLQLRGDTDRFAGDEALARVGRRRDDLAGLDADADLDPDAVIRHKALVQHCERRLYVEGRSCCAEGVVLVRHGNAERGHHGVARVLLDGAAVPRDRGGHGLEVALQDAAERLRVERFRKCHRLDDVDEQDRDEPPELHRRLREWRLLEQQRVVLAQDRRLELLQLGARVEAELLDEGLARIAVRRERIGLAPGAVEREHELPARPLAQGLRLDERLELGDELGVAREREVGVDPLFEGDRPQLLEPGDLGLRERLVEEVGESRAAPQAERLAESGLRCLGAPVLKRVSTLVGEADEAVRVDPVRVELEHVARRARGDDRPERLAELRHVDLDGVRGGLGRLSRPEALDEAVDGDDATDVEREDGEQCARLWPAEPDGTTARRRL